METNTRKEIMILEEKELLHIEGGAFHYVLLATLGAIGVFLAGVVDGIIRPLKCN